MEHKKLSLQFKSFSMILLEDNGKWLPKDTITLIASAIAVIFSAITYIQKLNEKNKGLRKQLTDILEKITTINIENEKFRVNIVTSMLPQNLPGLLNDQRRFFVRQAAFIGKEIKDMVTPYEWNIIADGFVRIDETEEADKFYKQAIDTAKSVTDKGICYRSYARFLIEEGLYDLANDYFSMSVKQFTNSSDRHIYYRATTYERWSNLFRKTNDKNEFFNKINLSIDEWKNHSNKTRGNKEIEALQKVTF